MAAASFSSSSTSGLIRRSHCNNAEPHPPKPDQLRPIIDPPPKAKPVFQVLAFVLIVFFACLQFLPATHLRDPTDPHRSWIPVDGRQSRVKVNSPFPFGPSRADGDGKQSKTSTISKNNATEFKTVHLVSWIDCLDLRVLAVLINSTLTTSRSPENVHFHFFVPEMEEKVSFFKLKVLFPDSNLDIVGQSEIKGKILASTPEVKRIWSLFPEIAPFVISSIKPSFRRFIYVSPVAIIKGSIEELLKVNMGINAVAAAEDCTSRLRDYVNMEIVNAIQRSGAKSWISKEHYGERACMPDLTLLVVDGEKLQKDILEAMLWWDKVLNIENDGNNSLYPSASLALHDRYLKLPSAWLIGKSTTNHDAKVLRFDGPMRQCRNNGGGDQGSGLGSNWQQYLSSKSEVILNH